MPGIAGLEITLQVRAVQFTDGKTQCRLALTGGGLLDLSPENARDVAAALLAAAQQ